MSYLRLAVLSAALIAASPLAFAQDSTSSASGKRVSIVGSATQLEPTRNAFAGDTQRIKADGDVTPTLGVTYHVNDNIGVEAWGAVDKYSHRVTGNDNQSKLGSVDSQPYAVSGQYQFGAADQTIRPFVGLGYYEQNFDGEKTAATGALAGQRVAVETGKGAMATVGVDANINERWFARADARYMHETNDPKVRVNGVDAADADFAPLTVGVGVGVKF